MSPSLRLPLALLAALALTARGAGEPRERGRPFLESFGPGSYHGHQQVFDIEQSATGFIYFANFGAVKEFDGDRWRDIAVPTSWIRELASDPEGRVWVAGVDELGWCERDSGATMRYQSLMDQLPETYRPLGTVWSVEWHDGAAWFATDRHVLRWHDGRFESWTFAPAPSQRLRKGGQQLWLARRGDGLYRWAEGAWKIFSKAEPVAQQPVNMIIDEPGGGALLGTGDGRLWRAAADGSVIPFAPELQGMLVGTRVTGGKRLRSGWIAVTTHREGVLVLDAGGKFIQRLGAEEGLPSSSVYSVTEDREDGVWIGTNMGAARVELASPYTLFGREDGRGATVALSLARGGDTFYLGSEEGLRRLVPAVTGTARLEPVPESRWRIFALLAHEDGLLVGTDAGLGRVVHGKLQIEQRSPLPVLSLARSRSSPDRIFVGFPETVVTYRRTAEGTWIDEGPIAALTGEARTLLEDSSGALWAGTTQRGYARVTRTEDQSWQNGTVEYFRDDRGLPPEPGWVRVIAGPGGPWFSTAQGLFVFDPGIKMFSPAPAVVSTQLAGKYTWPMIAVSEDELWVQVADSDAAKDLERPKVGRLARTDSGAWEWRPLPERILKQVGYFGVYEMYHEPGVLWLSGQSAVVRIETDRLDQVAPAGQPALTWRHISRADVGVLPLSGPPPVLPYSKAPLRVEFSRPGFSAGAVSEYSYRLLGFDDEWSDLRTNPEIEIKGLPAGGYTLQVRASDFASVPGGSLSYPFRIASPWQTSWPMLALYGVVGALAVFGLIRWRLAAMRRAQVTLENLISARTRELRQATRQAETASQSKSLFLASVSHELRTPLHAILGYAQLLENDRTLSSATRDRLQVVGASGRHLLRLINDVLDLSKIEAGKLELREESFSLPTLLTDVVDAQDTRAHAKGLMLRRPATASLPEEVVGDALKLRQVLENLLGNAVKFTEHGDITLRANRGTNDLFHFEVADTGPGIDAEELPRLFQPFHQGRGGRGVSAERGTGLGLAIAQQLVRLMGGEIKVASEPGRGSRFWFEIALPAPAPSLALPPGVRREYRGRGRRVLVVDDIAVNRELLRELLEPLGFVVELVESAELALAALERESADLLILDLRLPGMSGLDLARLLRTRPGFARLPILAASASALDRDPGEALRAGCSDFIAKPFLAEDLNKRISRLLDPYDPVARGSVEPFVSGASLDAATLRTLRAAAQEGDVLRVREEIRRVRETGLASSVLDEIERCAQAFDVDGVAAITTTCLKNLETFP